MVDQETLRFLRSPNPPPSNADLDLVFRQASHVHYMESIMEGRTRSFQMRHAFSNAAVLAALRTALQIREGPNDHLMSSGEMRFDFFDGEESIAQIELVTIVLRWSDRWMGDAGLVNPRALSAILKANCHPKLDDSLNRMEESARVASDAHQSWLRTWIPATPPGLGELAEALSWEVFAPEPKTRPAALSILAARYPTTEIQILALLAWFGHGVGPWSGCPAVEMAPQFLLESFSAEQVLSALRIGPLTRQQLEGACRFVTRYVQKPNQPTKVLLINAIKSSVIREHLLEYIRSTGDESKINAVTRAFA
jgi:hypothetical protein